MSRVATDERLLDGLWSSLGGGPDGPSRVSFTGEERLLPSVYDVGALASAAVAAATLAVAEVLAARDPDDTPRRRVHVDRAHAAVAFRSERYLEPIGWDLPPTWDPIAGDYEASDGWIRLHTNYAHHRDAVTRVLGVAPDRAAVASAVAGWSADALEEAVVGAGGCAAAMRTPAEWDAHPQGRAVASEPLFAIDTHPAPRTRLAAPPGRPGAPPLAGLRVVDLTRVISGPVCTRVLAAYGADVLRIDPPGFAEVPGLLGDTTVGKRCAVLDLRTTAGRSRFAALLADADVLVHGYRSDALDRLDFAPDALRSRFPGLVVGSLDAYGFRGPWSARRGFDSLVQMSSGIAARGMEATGARRPFPLPAQALDHATGYLLAAGVCHAVARHLASAGTGHVRVSLARTARLLADLGDDGDPSAPDLSPADATPWLEETTTAWGRLRLVRCPGRIDGVRPAWTRAPGPLGAAAASWNPREDLLRRPA